MTENLDRYHRQMLLPGFGEDGQRRLLASKALVVGCGALGTVAANLLARAGVGHLVIVDRDFIEMTNLQRQVLFDEPDVEQAIPKAEAAKPEAAAPKAAEPAPKAAPKADAAPAKAGEAKGEAEAPKPAALARSSTPV